MTDLTELKKKHAEMGVAHAELGAEIERLEKAGTGLWKPRIGEDYWTVTSTGEPNVFPWASHYSYARRLSIGNVFPTKEACERHIERLKVIQELKVLAGGYKPVWDIKTTNWRIGYDAEQRSFIATWERYYNSLTVVFFATKESAEAAIKALGPRLDILLGD